MTTRLYRERQLWSGNESVEIRYVNGSFVAGTSATSPCVPRTMHGVIFYEESVCTICRRKSVFVLNKEMNKRETKK